MPRPTIVRIAILSCLVGVGLTAGLSVAKAQNPQIDPTGLRERYRIVVSDDVYPQATPRDTVASIMDALETSNARYVMAHLVSPTQVDQRLRGDVQALEKLISGMTPAKSQHLLDQLDQHLAEGEWRIGRRYAASKVDGLPDVTLEKIGDRWFMYNVSPRTARQTPER